MLGSVFTLDVLPNTTLMENTQFRLVNGESLPLLISSHDSGHHYHDWITILQWNQEHGSFLISSF